MSLEDAVLGEKAEMNYKQLHTLRLLTTSGISPDEIEARVDIEWRNYAKRVIQDVRRAMALLMTIRSSAKVCRCGFSASNFDDLE
eukprot:3771222-Rhodomonas_salina.1